MTTLTIKNYNSQIAKEIKIIQGGITERKNVKATKLMMNLVNAITLLNNGQSAIVNKKYIADISSLCNRELSCEDICSTMCRLY